MLAKAEPSKADAWGFRSLPRLCFSSEPIAALYHSLRNLAQKLSLLSLSWVETLKDYTIVQEAFWGGLTSH
jgi:hypothetical protein